MMESQVSDSYLAVNPLLELTRVLEEGSSVMIAMDIKAYRWIVKLSLVSGGRHHLLRLLHIQYCSVGL